VSKINYYKSNANSIAWTSAGAAAAAAADAHAAAAAAGKMFFFFETGLDLIMRLQITCAI